MKERFTDFCPEYYTASSSYEIENEESLKLRYDHIQLRDTSELRLNNLCLSEEAGYPLNADVTPPN